MSRNDIIFSLYKLFKKAGMTEAAIFGMLGNWDCESNLEPGRLQGDFSPFRTLSKSYVAKISDNRISKQVFIHDGYGFGFAQWTFYSRKAGLWDMWKERGGTIDDPALQGEYCLQELQSNYQGLWETLTSNNDLYTCVKEICEKYERPAKNNIDARFSAAVRIKHDFNAEDVKQSDGNPLEKPNYFPPRVICKGMEGNDVSVLQALLIAQGYKCDGITGKFNLSTEEEVIQYQKDYHLDVDGIVGKQTWSKLKEIYFKEM